MSHRTEQTSTERILVTGASGFLGKRLCRKLVARGAQFASTSLSTGVDLRNPSATVALLRSIQPTVIMHCAAYVGGIQFGYKYPAEIFASNLRIMVNLFEAAKEVGVRRLINPLPNCTYPAQATHFCEDQWWDGPMHESVMTYGMVRKASWVGAWAFARQFNLDTINLIFSNMYGPEDHFEEERSHALGALIRKFVWAKQRREPQVVVWGTGKPVREWLHVDDAAEAMLRAAEIPPMLEPVNIGVGKGISVLDLARLIKEYVGYQGEIVVDATKPDGAAHKTVNGSQGERLLGWRPQIKLRSGVRQTVDWYLENCPKEIAA